MTLTTECAAIIQHVAKTGNGVVSVEREEDLEKIFQEKKMQKVCLLKDGGHIVHNMAYALTAKLEGKKATLNDYYDQLQVVASRARIFAYTEIVMDAGVPKCKRDTCQARRDSTTAEPYDVKDTIQSLGGEFDPERLVRSKRLLDEVMLQAMQKCAPPDARTIAINAAEWRLANEQNPARWVVKPQSKRVHMEADTEIPNRIEALQDDFDCFVVSGADGDFYETIMGRLFAGGEEFPKTVFFFRCTPTPICINMNIFAKFLFEKHKNLLGMQLGHMLTSNDFNTLREKVLFEQLGDALIMRNCIRKAREDGMLKKLTDPATFADAMAEIHAACVEEKKVAPRLGKKQAALGITKACDSKWKAYCTKLFPLFCAASRYWQGEIGDELDSVWNE